MHVLYPSGGTCLRVSVRTRLQFQYAQLARLHWGYLSQGIEDTKGKLPSIF